MALLAGREYEAVLFPGVLIADPLCILVTIALLHGRQPRSIFVIISRGSRKKKRETGNVYM
jgi:hypothetical protein